jgi:hypothetical protein
MAHDIYSGAQAYVSTTAQGADLNLAGFEALTWTEIKPVVSVPGLGTTRTGVDQTYLLGVTQTAKGSSKVNGGDLVCGNIPDDPGQVALKAMALAVTNRAFKFVRNTTLTAGTSVAETVYTRGVVLSDGDAGGGADDVVTATYTMAFNQLPIYDLP